MAGNVERAVHDAAEQIGWDDTDIISVLCEFIDEFTDPDDFQAFIDKKLANAARSDDEGEEEAEDQED